MQNKHQEEMMKKFAAAILGVLLVITLAGCASRPTYADGVYFGAGEVDGYSGYRTLVTVKVSGGYIESVDWNELHYMGQDKKSLGDAYGMKMASAVGKEWYEQAKAIEDALVKRGPDAIKTNEKGSVTSVSGASIGVSSILGTFEKAMAAAPVAEGAYTDGIYFASGDEVDGYQDTLSVVIANGSIVWAYWDKLATSPAEGEAATYRLQYAGEEFDTAAAAWGQSVLESQAVVGDETVDALLTQILTQGK